MLNGLQPWHIIIILLVVVVLFGAKRLPDAARGIGKSMRIFKAEAQKLHDDEGGEETSTPTNTAPPQQLAPPQPQTAYVAPPLEQTQARNESQH